MTETSLPSLNLPGYGAQLRRDERGATQIYDCVRAKWVDLTPEEWVRQHFVNMLINSFGYSPFRLGNERSIRINGRLRRCDTLIYDQAMRPVGIVEYKAPDVPVTQRVFDQIGRYNLVIGAPLLMVSNGLHTHALTIRAGAEGMAPEVNFLPAIPSYSELLELIQRP